MNFMNFCRIFQNNICNNNTFMDTKQSSFKVICKKTTIFIISEYNTIIFNDYSTRNMIFNRITYYTTDRYTDNT